MTRRSFIRRILLGGTGACVASYPIFIERNLVQINQYILSFTDLPKAFHGFTLAHLTDLHFSDLVSESFIEGIIEKTNRCKTDIIVCTGDYVSAWDSIAEIDRVWPILGKLRAKYGVYSVLGNHDHLADAERSLYWLERSGQNIRHKCKILERDGARLCIGGAGDYWEDDLFIDDTFSSTNEGDFRLLLCHNPDSIDSSFRTPVSLTLSGHTHGGQVVLPFFGPPVLPVSNKMYTSGVIAAAKTQLFISRGVGWVMLPVRFNCYPEIAVLRLVNPKYS